MRVTEGGTTTWYSGSSGDIHRAGDVGGTTAKAGGIRPTPRPCVEEGTVRLHPPLLVPGTGTCWSRVGLLVRLLSVAPA